METNSGKLIIFSAPSGSGKTTIVKKLLQSDLNLEFSISACTREPREGETDGVDYYFLSPDEFRKKIENNEFIEWEEVYKDQYYGTLKTELERIWHKNNHVIFDIDVKGGLNLKKLFGPRALSLFIKAPSIEELEKRLKNRSTDSDLAIKKRIAKAEYELTFAGFFDKTIVNDNIGTAFEETCKTVKAFLKNG